MNEKKPSKRKNKEIKIYSCQICGHKGKSNLLCRKCGSLFPFQLRKKPFFMTIDERGLK